jgi:hypothetical protein
MAKWADDDLEMAVARLAMCKDSFWAADPVQKSAVMMLLAKMCPSPEALYWLVDEVCDKVGTWPGPKELRGILCTKYDPADGVDAWCNIPGYRASDGEAKTLERHEVLKNGGYIAGEAGNYIRQLQASLKQLPQASKKVQ